MQVTIPEHNIDIYFDLTWWLFGFDCVLYRFAGDGRQIDLIFKVDKFKGLHLETVIEENVEAFRQAVKDVLINPLATHNLEPIDATCELMVEDKGYIIEVLSVAEKHSALKRKA